jgi:hypothetical protein
MTQALLRFRNGGFITLPSDEADETDVFLEAAKAAYY